jgi:two-component system, chemotaxis family, CheB/CheR fusion protein
VIAPAGPARVDTVTRTILIVDDDRSVADTFARMLRLEGFAVETALSAAMALDMASASRPDAIFLDMRMPAATGLEFLRRLRTIPGLTHIPVAIVTGDYFLTDPDKLEFRKLGAEIRYKPLFYEDLIPLARTLVNPSA